MFYLIFNFRAVWAVLTIGNLHQTEFLFELYSDYRLSKGINLNLKVSIPTDQRWLILKEKCKRIPGN